jgi:putative oxidoreductase
MWFIRGFLSLISRLMLCAIFVMSAVANKIPRFGATIAMMEAEGIPQAKYMLIGAIAFLILGSLLVILGYKARFGALLLLIFLALATYYFHDFWKIKDDQAAQTVEMISFMKNLGLGGAMLFLLANGSGHWSLDGSREDDDEFV